MLTSTFLPNVFVLAMVSAMVLAAVAQAASRPTENDVHSHQGYRGAWLKNEHIEAFVALQPSFRVLDVRRPGEKSLLADEHVSEQGIRLAFAEPDQVPTSFSVGNQPAKILDQTATSIRVQLEPASGLRYTVSVTLDARRPSLLMDCALENVGEKLRRVAPWVVAAFERKGQMLVPFGIQTHSRRRLVLSFWTAWPQPGVRFGLDTLLVDTAAAGIGDAWKIGIITNTGWGAFIRDGEALLSHVPFDPTAIYPEDGANITLFESMMPPLWCELEQLGPLRDLKPGQSAHILQQFSLFKVVTPGKDEPDAWRAALEKATPPAATQPSVRP